MIGGVVRDSLRASNALGLVVPYELVCLLQ
jgi:hypothetical protein